MKAYYNNGLRNQTPGWGSGPALDYGNQNAFLTTAIFDWDSSQKDYIWRE